MVERKRARAFVDAPRSELVAAAKELGVPNADKMSVEDLTRNLEYAQYPKRRELPSGRSSSRRTRILMSLTQKGGVDPEKLIDELVFDFPEVPREAFDQTVKMYMRDLGHVYGYWAVPRGEGRIQYVPRAGQ